MNWYGSSRYDVYDESSYPIRQPAKGGERVWRATAVQTSIGLLKV